MTPEQVIREALDDEMLTRTGRSVGDLASGHVTRAIVAALADAGYVIVSDGAEPDDAICRCSAAACAAGLAAFERDGGA